VSVEASTGGSTGAATASTVAGIGLGSRSGLPLGALALLLTAALLGAAPAEVQEVKVSREGFSPRVLSAHRGETLRLVVSSEDVEHCFAVDAFRVEKRVVPGRATAVELTPDRVGTYPFHCCLESGRAAEVERGRLVVTE
jgi:heme/copper-type cytochrome/quinol oxidase subunit 2